MRFRRLHAVAFGPHRNRDLDLDSDAVVVFGRNESGKSSFRAAIETLLYGFEPAARDRHPLAAWGGGRNDDLHVEARFMLDTGEELAVERVLQATGKMRTAQGGADFSGARRGNSKLSIVDGLPRKVFGSIYSVEVQQLTRLEESVQTHVDDLLLPTADSLQLRPVAKVRADLRADHQSLWRENRVGNPRARVLLDDLAKAKKRLREAEADENALRAARSERVAIEAKLEAAVAEKSRLERESREAPLLRDWFDLKQREQRLGPDVDLTPLAGRGLVDPADLRNEMDELERELAIPLARLEEDPLELSEEHRGILDASAEIRAVVDCAGERRANRGRCREAEAQLESQLRESGRALAGLLAGGTPADDPDWVDALPLEQLRSAQSTWARAFEASRTDAQASRRSPLWAVAIAAIVAAGVPGVAALWLAQPIQIALVSLLGVLGGVLAYHLLSGSGRPASEPPARPAEIDALLGNRSFAPALTASPTELQRAIDVLGEVQRDRGEAARVRTDAEKLADEVADFERRGEALCRRLGVDASSDAEVWIERLRQALDAAREGERLAREDAARRREAETEIQARTPELARLRAHLGAVEQILRDAEPQANDPSDAFRRVRARLNDQEYVRKQRSVLASQPAHAALAGDARTTGEAPPESADSAEAELQTLDEAIARDNQRLGDLKRLLGQDEGSRAAQARDEVQDLDDRLAAARRERDRLALLEAVLLRAEKDFREEHQPDVLRRASDHLRRVTGGRYQTLFYEEGSGLHVACSDLDEPVPVDDPISRGTLDQIFLCLRLGLLDHLDEGREKLPLVLDDALVRMDDVRRREVYALLADVSTRRQIFLLTCHENIAGEATTALEAARVDLSGD